MFRKIGDPIYGIIILVSLVSLSSFFYLLSKDLIVIHTDALGHLNTARKVLFGTPPGLGQLGGIWLPLQHLSMLPLVWIDPLYYSGAAGSIISMISYVLTSLFLYKLIFKLTTNWQAAFLGVLIFALNPNVIIYQAAPMMELLSYFTFTAGVYFFYLWEEKSHYSHLLTSALFLMASCVTRYEAWSITLFLALVIAIKIYKKNKNFKQIYGTVFYFLSIALSGVAVWILYLTAIFKDPLFFLTSQYSPSVYVELAQFGGIAGVTIVNNPLDAVNLTLSVLVANSGIFVFLLAILGLIIFLIKNSIKRLSLISLIMPVFLYVFLVSVHQLLIFYDSNTSYQVRYGTFILIPAAVFIGYLINSIVKSSLFQKAIQPTKSFTPFSKYASLLPIFLIFSVIATTYVSMVKNNKIATLTESKLATIPTAREINLRRTGEWLSKNYDSGKILMALFQNEEVLFYSKIPTNLFIHEGSQKLFDLALEKPQQHVDWIVTIKAGFTDLVTERLQNSQILEEDFYLAYEGPYSHVYHKKVF